MDDVPVAAEVSGAEPLGLRVKRLRSERKLSQDRLAIEAHVDQSGLSKFERGRRYRIGRSGVERIARVFGISFDALVSGTDFDERNEDPEGTGSTEIRA
jgi:transcriptional regulator with XRE-family HTH domain